MDQLFSTNVNTTFPIFPNINQLDHNKQQLVEYIYSNIIGKNLRVNTPWRSPASERGLIFIEYYMLNKVLHYYANTHSENTAWALQGTKFRTTDAISKLVNVLHLEYEKVRSTTVIFISTFEHHSNILPWKEAELEVIRIPNNKHVKKFELMLIVFQNLFIIYDGWIFWNYATAALYVKIDMNLSEIAYKDAVFISMYKFVDGPLTPGILIAKKKNFLSMKFRLILQGSTVEFVTRTHIEYVKDIEIHEEGVTANMLDVIRAGLVFHLKESVRCHTLEAREDALVAKIFRKFSKSSKTNYT
ncbi:unnamed protein product [Rotaria sp. Silwood2]|nr:unnamed protein product [Rotaria sp. Silwood2]